MLTLCAVGRFEFLDAAGIDYSPSSRKACGILALLALSPGYRRSRAWLQEKLWSDRGGEQAAASLRQALRDIRRHLGAHCAILRSDRVAVSLDTVYVNVSFQSRTGSGRGEREAALFEDLDIGDPQFAAWLQRQRVAISKGTWRAAGSDDPPTATVSIRNRRRAVIFVTAGSIRDGEGERIARRVLNLAADAIRPHIDAEFLYSSDDGVAARDPETDEAVVIKATVNELSSHVAVAVMVSDLASRCVVFAREITLDAGVADPLDVPQFVRMVNRVAKATLDLVMRGPNLAWDDGLMALRLFESARILTFTLDKENLELADQQCRAAFERSPRGSLLAWRSFIRQVGHFHHRTCDFLSDRRSSGELTSNALDRFPDDSLVLSLGAHAEYLFGDSSVSAMRLARRATTANALDPLAWAALANLQTVTGDHLRGYQSARRAIELSAGTPAAYFFEFYGCMAAAGLGDYELASQHARTSRASSPRFAPPRRYMVALGASAGDQHELLCAVQGLKTLEPSFELALLLEESYPVNTLRRMPLIDVVEGRVRRAAFLETT